MSVSGPVNVVRLEGNINNIPKVIYIVMDIHMSPNEQSECKDIRSKHIKKYLNEPEELEYLYTPNKLRQRGDLSRFPKLFFASS